MLRDLDESREWTNVTAVSSDEQGRLAASREPFSDADENA
jgi:hypothetical protein